MRGPRLRAPFIGAGIALALSALAAPVALAADSGQTVLVSGLDLPAGAIAGSDTGHAAGQAFPPDLSLDGRYAVFVSAIDDLAPGTSPDRFAVFRKDRTTGDVILVSRADGITGAPALSAAARPQISDDGNRVTWQTDGPSIEPSNPFAGPRVYIRDIATGVTKTAAYGANVDYQLSGDGSTVVFATDQGLTANDFGGTDVYTWKFATGGGVWVSQGGPQNNANQPTISDDGEWVAFVSQDQDVVNGFVDGAGAGASTPNVYVRDVTAPGQPSFALVSSNSASATTGGNGASGHPRIAGTATIPGSVKIAYTSAATDVAVGGVDGSSNASVYQRAMGGVPSTLVSVGVGGNANAPAALGGIRANGSTIVFSTAATNLGDAAGTSGVYARDVPGSRTTELSVPGDRSTDPVISGDGTYAAWYGPGSATVDGSPDLGSVLGRTPSPGFSTPAGPIQLLSRPAGSAPIVAGSPAAGAGMRTVSADGRYMVFSAQSSRLPGGPTPEVYRRDLRTGAIDLVSRADGLAGGPVGIGSSGPSIDASGNRVAFAAYADLDPADHDLSPDLYVRDIAAGTTMLVSRAGASGDAVGIALLGQSISADGTHAAFVSTSGALGVPGGVQHVWARDLGAQTTTLVDRATGAAGTIGGGGYTPAMSSDGSLVVFASGSTNLDPDDSTVGADVYVRDMANATTRLVSRRPGASGAHATGASVDPAISDDGTVVAFVTSDAQLAPEAGAWPVGSTQVVARNLGTAANTLVSRVAGGGASDGLAYQSALSADGSVVAFASTATNLIAGLGGAHRMAVYARSMASGELSGPPAFGIDDPGSFDGANSPSLSANGQCLGLFARGHNAASGIAGDFMSAYVYTVSGVCPGLPVAGPVPPGVGPGLTVTPTPPIATPPLALPTLTKVSLTPSRFKVGKAPTALAASAKPKRKLPTGTSLRFTFSTKATLTVTIERPSKGRQSGKSCVKPKPSLAKKRACVRYGPAGTLTRAGLGAGPQVVAFSGRVGKKKLAPGKYRATLRATNAAGASAPVALSFTVLR